MKIRTQYYKIFYIVYSALCIGGILLFPITIRVTALPEWVAAIFSLLIVAAAVLFLLFVKKKKAVKIVVSSVGVLAVAVTLYTAYWNPLWNSVSLRSETLFTKPYQEELTLQEATVDLDMAIHYFRKIHPAAIREIPDPVRQAYHEALTDLKQAERIDSIFLCSRIEKVLSVMNDAHTSCDYNLETYHYLKQAYSRQIRGDDLIKINGVSLKELFEEKSNLYSYESELWAMCLFIRDVQILEGLYYLGIDIADGVRYTWKKEDGTEETEAYTAEDFVTKEEYRKFNQLEEPEGEEVFVSYTIFKENNLAVLTLDRCIDNEEYRNCLEEMFREVKEQQIGNVAVDLRNNTGGNAGVFKEFARYLSVNSYRTKGYTMRRGVLLLPHDSRTVKNNRIRHLAFEGNLYVLSSSKTFSAAMMFAEAVKDNGIGTIIGEPSGNAPDCYSSTPTLVLPNSKLFLNVSAEQHWRIDRETEEKLIMPDIPCDEKEAMGLLFRLTSGEK